MTNKLILTLCSGLILTLAHASFADEELARPRPRPTPPPAPTATPAPPTRTGQWFKPRTLVCDDANLRFEVKVDSAKPNGLISEQQPHFDQHVVWTATAKTPSQKQDFGKLSAPGSQPGAPVSAIHFDGNQTGWYSPSLKTLVGSWVWVPNASDVLKNTGIVQPKSSNLKITLEDGSVHDDVFSTVVRMDHIAPNVTLRIDSGSEGGAASTNYTFAESQCQGEDGL